MLLVWGIVGLLVTGADTVRLFLRANDYSPAALAVWTFWGVSLAAPLAWAVRQRGRAAALGREVAPAIRDELWRSAWGTLLLGYGMAVFALRVVDLCLRR